MRPHPLRIAPSTFRVGLLAVLLSALVAGCAHRRKAYYLNGTGGGSEVRVEAAPAPVVGPVTGRNDPPGKSAEARRGRDDEPGEPVGQADAPDRD